MAKGTKGGHLKKEGLEGSPGGSIFTGPIISDVAWTVKEAQNTNSETALCSWKRKYGDEVVERGLKKRKVPEGGGKVVEKERQLDGNLTNESG